MTRLLDYMSTKLKGRDDDHYDTPQYAVEPLIQYIPKQWTVWECTDTTGNSQITKTFKQHGSEVISTNKNEVDFLRDEPDFGFDCIITNPPYTIKDAFIERCIEIGKPWAMLMPLTALEGVKRGRLYNRLGKDFGIIVLDRRVEFTGGSVWFNTSWYCYKILPRQLIFQPLIKNEGVKKK